MTIIDDARRLADEVLFPSALATDVGGVIPKASLDALAEAGLYGLVGPWRFGGLGAEPATAWSVMEALAGGCLTSAFIWAQHHVAVRIVSVASDAVAHRWAPSLCSGEIRAGVAFAHLRREGTPPIVALPDSGSGTQDCGWRVTGTANWMTGWGGVGVINVAAVHGDNIVWLLTKAVESETLSVRPLPLSAVNASCTVELTLVNHFVAPDEVIAVQRLDEWRARDRLSLRQNGSFSLGLVRRCVRLLSENGTGLGSLADEAAATLDRLASAQSDLELAALAQARADTSWLAVRASAALIAAEGGKSMILNSHAQRLGREALFLLVQGQTAPIRAAQLQTLQ